MEKRIELEKRNRTVDQIQELNLDNCRSTTIEGLTDEFVNLKSLSLNGVGLTSLKGFPALPNLRKLEMGDNRISGGLQILKGCTSLTMLNLSNNKIKDLESLEPLKDLPAVKSLDLYRNDVTQLEDYRNKVFELLPGLSYLDGTDKGGNEDVESDLDDDEGAPVNGKGGRNDVHSTGNGAEDSSSESLGASPSPDAANANTNEADSYEGSSSDEDAEEEEEEEEEVGLKDIYREDLEKESDGGDYEEEEESEEDSDDGEGEYDTSLDTSRVLDEEGEPSGAVATATSGEGVEDEEEGDETEVQVKRGVKRQHEDGDDLD